MTGWRKFRRSPAFITLATNAIVEGRGARVGLIYMGAELEDKVPADLEVKVKGRFDIMGRLRE